MFQSTPIRSFAIIAALLFASIQSSWAAETVHLYITGETQGEIKGSVTQAGREDSIAVNGFNHEVAAARDAASGLPTGKRQHKPITVVKDIDKSSPLLFQALVNSENLTTVKFRFWRPSKTGLSEQFYTIELVGAKVSSIKTIQLNNKESSYQNFAPMEEVSFTYQKIIWTYEDGGITAEDDWESPNA